MQFGSLVVVGGYLEERKKYRVGEREMREREREREKERERGGDIFSIVTHLFF